jgi:hypothetical protein
MGTLAIIICILLWIGLSIFHYTDYRSWLKSVKEVAVFDPHALEGMDTKERVKSWIRIVFSLPYWCVAVVILAFMLASLGLHRITKVDGFKRFVTWMEDNVIENM